MADKSPKNDSFDEKLFRYIYNSKVFRDMEDDPLTDDNLFDIVGDARSYNEARNRIVQALKKNNDYGILDEAVNRYNDLHGASDNVQYSTDRLLPIDEMKYRGSLGWAEGEEGGGVDALDVEDVLERANQVAAALGYDVKNHGTENLIKQVRGIDGETPYNVTNPFADNYQESLRSKILEKLDTDAKRDKYYYDLGITPTEKDDYGVPALSKLLQRAENIINQRESSDAGKLVFGLAAPNTYRSAEEGRTDGVVRSLNDLAFDFLPAYPAYKVASGKYPQKFIDIAQKVGVDPDNLVVKSGISSLLGGAFSSGHNLVDSLATKHVYSEGEGDNDISERGDIKKALLSGLSWPLLMNTGLGIITGYAGAQRAFNRFNNAGASKSIKGAVRNGWNRLFGKEKGQRLANERAALQQELEELTADRVANAKNMNVDDFDWNVGRSEDIKKRIDEISSDEAVKAIDGSTKIGLDALRTAYLKMLMTPTDMGVKGLRYLVKFADQ